MRRLYGIRRFHWFCGRSRRGVRAGGRRGQRRRRFTRGTHRDADVLDLPREVLGDLVHGVADVVWVHRRVDERRHDDGGGGGAQNDCETAFWPWLTRGDDLAAKTKILVWHVDSPRGKNRKIRCWC